MFCIVPAPLRGFLAHYSPAHGVQAGKATAQLKDGVPCCISPALADIIKYLAARIE
jgi:hypothetical protein